MRRFRSSLAVFAVAAASGCSAPELAQPGPALGKADGLGSCPEGQTCLPARSYDVLFTNPVCQDYGYDEPLATVSGESVRAQKPKNVYCTKGDAEASGQRPQSPQFRLAQWLDALDDGDEVFLAYLSFSNPVITTALCEAAERGVQIDFVLDSMSSSAETLQECGGRVHIRGHQGSVGYQHNKLIMINPNGPGPNDSGDDADFIRISFGSGNMSSGVVLHHENWHFLEVARDSFFVEAHRCLVEALLESEHTDGKGAFRSFMKECRQAIPFDEEDDIKSFFIPSLDDSKAAIALMLDRIDHAQRVDIGAHRFSFSDMIERLETRLSSDEDFSVRLVADDDLYWTNPAVGTAVEVGPNLFQEGQQVEGLEDIGGERFEARYLETNHALHLLHHNKFLIFSDVADGPDSVLYGAANLTATGFKDNLENIYWTDIPVVVDAFEAQYRRFWDGEPFAESDETPPIATAVADMPVELVTVSAND